MSVDETDERLSRGVEHTQRASLVEAMLETGVSIPPCACLPTAASRLAVGMKPCAPAPADHVQCH